MASAQVIRGMVAGTLAGHRLGGVQHGLGHEVEHVLLADEGRLHVQLGELELAVGPEVLVPQAAGDLVVAVDPGHHQQLLGQLRALGQDVAATRGQPAGHGELPGPLGGRRPQQRRLHLDEALAVHGGPQGAVDRGPQPQVGLHPGPAQVDEAVLQPDHLVHLDPVVDGERRRLGRVEHGHRAVAQLDLAGGEVGVDRALGAGPDSALHGHHVLAAHVHRARGSRTGRCPVWSRTSMKARCSPCSRRLATQPHTVTAAPTSSARSDPHRSGAHRGGLGDGEGTVTAGPFGGAGPVAGARRHGDGGGPDGRSIARGRLARTASTTSARGTVALVPVPRSGSQGHRARGQTRRDPR